MRRGLVVWFWGCFLFFISGEERTSRLFEGLRWLPGLKPSAYMEWPHGVGASSADALRVPDYDVLAGGEM
jgi:hypothetical protein